MLSFAPEAVDLRGYLAECRALAIAEIRRFVPSGDAHAPILYDLMLEYPLREAKGLRPTLCIATCRALGGGLEAVLPSAAILELYHNAFLIHDDVEDGSEQRRDRPTLHREHGVPVAINVGDGMLALALGPLLDNTKVVGLGRALRIMQTIARMARETAEGQAIELDWIRRGCWNLDDDDYRHMVVKKTGWYSFIAPITLGAIVAGAEPAQLEALVEMARELAIAFQIRDDVLNLQTASARYGKEANGDLWEGKRTVILLHAMRALAAPDRARAEAILARSRPDELETLLDELERSGDLTAAGRARLGGGACKSVADIAELRAWIHDSRSIEYAESICRDHAERARAALERCGLTSSIHLDVLRALIDFTIDREH
ncbi:MAG: polyprenyl synthetase family protein [Kofleriaceae bacterium]